MYDNPVKFSHAVNLRRSKLQNLLRIGNSLIEVSKKFLECLSSVQRYFEVLVCYFFEVGSFQGASYRRSDRSKHLALHKLSQNNTRMKLYPFSSILSHNFIFRARNIFVRKSFLPLPRHSRFVLKPARETRIHFIRFQCYSQCS